MGGGGGHRRASDGQNFLGTSAHKLPTEWRNGGKKHALKHTLNLLYSLFFLCARPRHLEDLKVKVVRVSVAFASQLYPKALPLPYMACMKKQTFFLQNFCPL